MRSRVSRRRNASTTLFLATRCIQAEGSSLRGGSLALGGTARIRELGSTGQAATHVRLGPRARVVADTVHPGVVLELPGGELVRYSTLESDVDVGELPAAA